ncbi:MAG: Flp pilus assembly complex ATPase component TadA [Oscillospiraceae bacterium]|nr:Flp pilus assembly complex ATPase component TadA [Oscillospiraceae bacterium]
MEQKRFDEAAAYLPRRWWRHALLLDAAQKAAAEEIRLRVGRAASVLICEEEISFGGAEEQVTAEELDEFCSAAAEHSPYASQTLKKGYLTLRGGFRAGFCGTAVVKMGEITALKDISSAVIRICSERKGVAEKVMAELWQENRFPATLILSPPGVGKTTFLRDAVRCLGERVRVSLVDERGEIAAVCGGIPQMDIGRKTDVLDGCPKAEGIFMALRVMNPQVVAVDEITEQEDIRAVTMASNCGVSVLATIHARDKAELKRKPLFQDLLKAGVFSRIVKIERVCHERRYIVEELT